ncbi:MAG: hypothetical protein KIPDCIKN_02687 [Haliscomenobacter sp.]|nr:hypothetical protein [Haliscomenobacter sp.]
MSHLQNKIEADDRSVFQVLDNQKYTVDFFQREYKWEEKHIEQLVSDLTSAFLNEYQAGHQRKDVARYNSYYLGPFVVSASDGKRSIIDGQQRLTSLTLLLIYLNNLQKELGINEKIESLIFSEMYGEKSFNIQVEERRNCLEQLFSKGEYDPSNEDDESTINMAARYRDIANNFPDEIKGEVFPFFLDWLKYNVVLVEIIAYSDENAYTIFETMNDRGLNLTPTEMLKGFLLSKFGDVKTRQKANESWKTQMQGLQVFDNKDEDQRFFQAWLRSQYADTIRPGKAGSKNEDFEKIGTRFHSWVRDNLNKVGLTENDPSSFEHFLSRDFLHYLNAYRLIRSAENAFNPKLEYVFYIRFWGIANSLSYPLLLAPVRNSDTEEVVCQKINLVARYIESFTVRRAVNFRKFAASSIRYTMYTLVKEIRGQSLEALRDILQKKSSEMEEPWDGLLTFRMHGQNKYFVKYLLSRMTAFLETHAGIHSSFEKYFLNPNAKPYEVEHIWADKFEEHRDEFEQISEFKDFRNRLGGLILLPRGTNQSLNDLPYNKKAEHYLKENLLAMSLCSKAYQNNPNFLNMVRQFELPFKAHEEFKRNDFTERQELYYETCKQIWGRIS